MKKLLIDNSNGRTKFALAERENICSEVRVMPTAAIAGSSVSSLLQGWCFEKVVLCSVVPDAATALEHWLAPIAPVTRVQAMMSGLPVDFAAYPGRETLGADRVANVVGGAAAFAGKPVLVIDAGTATTLDIVLPAVDGGYPRYLGGSIAPGVGTVAAVLHQATAQLPPIRLELPLRSIGRNTEEAMQSGCVLGYRGLLRELVAEAEKECSCRFKLLATGGDAALMAQLLPEMTRIDPLLTLRGIALCCA